MTLTLAPDAAPRSSPLAALMAAVRPEHRGDLLTPPAGHPLVDRGGCRVPDCPGVATAGRGLCVAHADRWYRARRRCRFLPYVSLFLTSRHLLVTFPAKLSHVFVAE